MPNYSQYDEDEYRLPENMTRIGYDADAQVYSYRDACGKLHQGAPGNRYDVLRPVTDEPHYPTAASYLEAHKEHHNSSSSSSSPMTSSLIPGMCPIRTHYPNLSPTPSAHSSAPSHQPRATSPKPPLSPPPSARAAERRNLMLHHQPLRFHQRQTLQPSL